MTQLLISQLGAEANAAIADIKTKLRIEFNEPDWLFDPL